MALIHHSKILLYVTSADSQMPVLNVLLIQSGIIFTAWAESIASS